MFPRRLWVLFLAFQVSLSAQVAPVVLFSDNFNVPIPTTDLNLLYDSSMRQSGSLGFIRYAELGPTAFLANWDAATSLGTDQMPGNLLISHIFVNNSVAAPGYISVAPMVNFVQSGHFMIEFAMDPGVNDTGTPPSSDWACVVFGSPWTNPGWVITEGVGILFRNNGDIQVFSQGQQAYAGPGLPGGMPAGEYRVEITVKTDDFKGSPAVISMRINGTPCLVSTATNYELHRPAGFVNNWISLAGYRGGSTGWIHAFDDFSVKALPKLELTPSSYQILKNRSQNQVTLTVPQALVSAQAVSVVVSSSNPEVAVPAGSDSLGRLTLNFPQGGANTQVIPLTGKRVGNARLIAETTAPIGRGVATLDVATGTNVTELILHDTFDTTASTDDINAELAARQQGLAAPLDWLELPFTAAGGATNQSTRILRNAAGGRLEILPTNQFLWVSPNRSFADGQNPVIEFNVQVGHDRLLHNSLNWAAVTFACNSRGAFVNTTDGLGILFRNNGNIQLFDGGQLIYNSTDTPLAPGGNHKIRIELETAPPNSNLPYTAKFFANDQPLVVSVDGSNRYVRRGGILANNISLLVNGVEVNSVFDDFKVYLQRRVSVSPERVTVRPGRVSDAVTITLPRSLGQSSRSVQVRSLQPEVAVPTGGTDGVLTLPFTAGGPLSQTFTVTGVKLGAALFEITTSDGLAVRSELDVTVGSAWITNPSFEDNTITAWPGYGAISSWRTVSGGVGVNNRNLPFADNGVVPDRSQVAFLQIGAIEQALQGLDPTQQYWLQFRYNTRAGTPNPTTLRVLFNNQQLAEFPDLFPTYDHYYRATVPFIPGADSGSLQFRSEAAIDSTVVLDAVTITPRSGNQVIIENPSFEASGYPPGDGTIAPAPMAGWSGEGQYGVIFAPAHPTVNYGPTPDQDCAAFLRGFSSIQQQLNGLVLGETYRLEFFCNAAPGTSPHMQVMLGGQLLLDQTIEAAGGGDPYHFRSVTFVPEFESEALAFQQIGSGDPMLLLDDVRVIHQASAANIPLNIRRNGAGQVRIAWPSDASGYQLEAASDLPGAWILVPEVPVLEGTERAVYAPLSFPRQFFRLKR